MVRYRHRNLHIRKGQTPSAWVARNVKALILRQANWLVNDAIEKCVIDNLGVVVMDELHMIDDYHRGYLMELIATKLLALQDTVQLIGMSATLSVCSTHAHLQA